MKKVYGFLMLLVCMTTLVVGQVDIVALKKNMQEDAAIGIKKMVEEAQKASSDLKLNDALADLFVKTYPRDEHESFRLAEEKKLIDRINAKTQKLSDEMANLVEKAFVDVMKEQQLCEDLCRQDIAAFKQQFSEGVQKMAQGKKATPITYVASEGVVKGAYGTKKTDKSAPVKSFTETKNMPAILVDDMPPFKSLSEPKKSMDVTNVDMPIDDSAGFDQGVPVDLPGAYTTAPVSVPAKSDLKVDVKKTSSAKAEKKPSLPSKAQADLLKQIRG